MIALDAMGGDFAPQAPIQGALRAAARGVPILLFGPEDRLRRELDQADSAWQNYAITIVDAPQIIGMGDDPVSAVRSKKDSSLVRAVASVKQGTAKAVISAGNSGALMTAAALILGRMPGIDRPAISGFLPSQGKPVFSLDLGANADCKPQYLVQFARMGVEHYTRMFPGSTPRVGLLSNGEEEGKGSLLVKDAYQLLRGDEQINFIGNVEPTHIVAHKVDLVVCDGFAGNVLLKAMEATAQLAYQRLKQSAQAFCTQHPRHAQTIQTFLQATKKRLQEDADPSAVGGGVLLGVNGLVLVAHGGAHADALGNALINAWQMVAEHD